MFNEELLSLIENGESVEIECKSAQGGLPKDIWETYSAFANTNGGVIFLGIAEKNRTFEVIDIDAQKLLKEFWDGINNTQRISKNILSDKNATIITVDGKRIIKISVPRATREQRPIYIGPNPLTGSYRRNYEGDYKCTKQEVQRRVHAALREALVNTLAHADYFGEQGIVIQKEPVLFHFSYEVYTSFTFKPPK